MAKKFTIDIGVRCHVANCEKNAYQKDLLPFFLCRDHAREYDRLILDRDFDVAKVYERYQEKFYAFMAGE